jgi:hypothetical protein
MVKGNTLDSNYYLMQPYATKPCNDNWLAAKYLQLIIPGLYVAIGLLQVAPWRAHGQEILILLVLRMQEKHPNKIKTSQEDDKIFINLSSNLENM